MGRAQRTRVTKAVATSATRLVAARRRRTLPPPPEPGQYVGSLQRTTNKGLSVQLGFWRNVQDGIKEAWTVELIEAHADGIPAGYLKISYIPTEEMERWYPTAFEYAVREGGRYAGVLGHLLDKPEAEWTREELLESLGHTDPWNHSEYFLAPAQKRSGRCSDAELRVLWQQRRQSVADEYQERYQRFRSSHEDRPLVDFIRAYAGNEILFYTGGVQVKLPEELKRNCRRLGLGSLLYETGALWMHERGLPLYASGVQSKEALSAWAGLRQRGLVKTVEEGGRTRQVFAVETLLAEHPELLPLGLTLDPEHQPVPASV